MIKSLSAYYLSTPWVSPLTGATATEYTLSIYVWDGEQAAPPLQADYEITKKNHFDEVGNSRVMISRLVNDFILFRPTTLTGTGVLSSDNQVWCKTEVVYTTSNPADTGVIQNASTQLVTKGYGYGIEGDNPQLPTSGILLEGDIFRVSRSSKFTLPLLLDVAKTGTVISYPNNQINYSFSLSAVTDSSTIVKLLTVDTSDATSDEYIEIKQGGYTITLIIKEEYKYTPVDIVFINKEGAQQSLTFFKERRETTTVTRSQYQGKRGSYDQGYHEFIDYMVNGKDSFRVNSGYVPESQNEAFKQLILSTSVYLRNGSEYIALNVLKNSLEYKTRLNDRLINYEFEFGYSYSTIQKI